jgi:hypothetical protein
MATTRCPDCDDDKVSLITEAGDGKCACCHGTGRDGGADLWEGQADAAVWAVGSLFGLLRCGACNGSGECPTCRGTGIVDEELLLNRGSTFRLKHLES